MYDVNRFSAKRIFKIALPFLILAAAVIGTVFLLKWYYTPIRKTVEMTVCSIDGEVETVQFDLTYYRILFAPTQVSGTVTFKGIEHKDYFAHIGRTLARGFFGERSFGKDLKEKLSGRVVYPYFSQNQPFSEDGWGSILFILNDYEADKDSPVVFAWNQSNDNAAPHVIFFGPADSAEEARALNDAFVSANSK